MFTEEVQTPQRVVAKCIGANEKGACVVVSVLNMHVLVHAFCLRTPLPHHQRDEGCTHTRSLPPSDPAPHSLLNALETKHNHNHAVQCGAHSLIN